MEHVGVAPTLDECLAAAEQRLKAGKDFMAAEEWAANKHLTKAQQPQGLDSLDDMDYNSVGAVKDYLEVMLPPRSMSLGATWACPTEHWQPACCEACPWRPCSP